MEGKPPYCSVLNYQNKINLMNLLMKPKMFNALIFIFMVNDKQFSNKVGKQHKCTNG